MSVLWPSKYAKIRFRLGICPGPSSGSTRRSPDPLVSWRGDTPPHTPPHSARTHLRRSPCVPPEVQPDLRLWGLYLPAQKIRIKPKIRICQSGTDMQTLGVARIFPAGGALMNAFLFSGMGC